jgi:hypothetical protein
MHYSIDGDPFITAATVELSPNEYVTSLPSVSCGSIIRYYFSAEEQEFGRYETPSPDKAHQAIAAESSESVLQDNFESDQGWTTFSTAFMGEWERGVPAGDGSNGDPPSDFDGSGSCFLTGNTGGDSGVDGGVVQLFSPVMDLSSGIYKISYARWYYNDNATIQMTVSMSNNGGATYYPVEAVGPHDEAAGGWFVHELWVDDYVTPTANMKLRFNVYNDGHAQTVEAAVDAVTVTRYDCPQFLCGDADGSWTLSISDAVFLINHIFKGGPAPVPPDAGNADCTGGVNVSDAVYIVSHVFRGGPPPCCP